MAFSPVESDVKDLFHRQRGENAPASLRLSCKTIWACNLDRADNFILGKRFCGLVSFPIQAQTQIVQERLPPSHVHQRICRATSPHNLAYILLPP
jgi:hypothetical protein